MTADRPATEPEAENVELLRRLDDWDEHGRNPGPLIRWAAAHLRGCLLQEEEAELDRPATEPRTGPFTHADIRWLFNNYGFGSVPTDDPSLTDDRLADFVTDLNAHAASQERPEPTPLSEGAAPRAEGLERAARNVVKWWDACPGEAEYVGPAIEGLRVALSRPSDERIPESEEA